MRRLSCVLVIVILSFCMSGCSIHSDTLDSVKSKFESYKNEKEKEKAVREAEESTKQAIKESEKEQKKAEREEDYASLYTEEIDSIKDELYENGSWLGKKFASLASVFSSKTKEEIYAGWNEKEIDEAVHGKSNDKRLDEEAADKEREEERKDHFLKFVPLIIIAIVIVLLVLLFIFLSSRSEKRTVKVKAPKPDKAPAQTDTDIVNVRYKRVLKDNCAKLGVDYNNVLSQYNGDVTAAVNATNLQLYRK